MTPTATAAATPTTAAVPTRTTTGPSGPNALETPIARVKHSNLKDEVWRMAQNGRIAADVRSAEMLGVIGGSGFYTFFGSDARTIKLDTPYGAPSAPITVGTVGRHEVAFLPRHGVKHEFSPHIVPYRANMWALRALGVRRIF